MTVFVDVVVDVPQVDATFTYHLSPEQMEAVTVGSLVVVPFGEQTVPAVVVRRMEQTALERTRAVQAVLDPEPVVTPQQLRLAQQMATATLSPLAAWMRLMLPPGVSRLSDTLYRLTAAGEALSLPHADLTPAQQRLVRLLQQRGPLRGRQLDRALPRTRWRRSAQALRRKGFLTSEAVLAPLTIRPRTERWVAALEPTAPEAALPLGRAGSAARQRRADMLHRLREAGGTLPARELCRQTGGTLADLRRLAEVGLVRLFEREIWRDPLAAFTFVPAQPPPLTAAQQAAWEVIAQALQQAAQGQIPRPVLLHGVTGSGKTEVYLRAIQQVLEQGRQALLLVPEIALTPQTVQRVLSRFPERVGLWHSRLSEGERYDTWRRTRAGEIDILIGPRSALFLPMPRLGLIVMDECHEEAYARQESLPAYHARDVAVAYARLWPAVCLMGSATPDVVSMYQVERGHWLGVELPDRILAHREAVRRQMGGDAPPPGGRYRPAEGEALAADLPAVQVVDMRAELRAGHRSIFSRALQQALNEVLSHGQQAILFLNRLGMATYVFCRDCGQVLRCPHCTVPLTYHHARAQLLCHHCHYTRRLPTTCPACGSQRIRHYGTGTERVEAEVQRLFPQARTLRWDRETTRQKGAHARILARFAAGEANVLIGTQMLAKGLDLPRVTLVGIVLAEVGLSLPDYRAAERVFQVLTQVAGRAGRSPLGGQVILQTFQPHHYAIQAAARHDYWAFYRHELRERARLGYPPFARLARLLIRDTDEERAQQRATRLAEAVRTWAAESGQAVTLIGPVPCFFERRGGVYRWQVVVRGADVVPLLRRRPLNDVLVEINPVSLL